MNATRLPISRFIALFLLCQVGLTSCFSTKSARRTSDMAPAEIRLRQNITSYAENFIGAPYKYGGESPNGGFDCSGFTSYVMLEYGIALDRTSSDQGKMGKKVALKDSKAGDLIFFARKGRVFHVSLVVANTKEGIEVVHATSSRGVIRENISTSSYWSSKEKFVRDVLANI